MTKFHGINSELALFSSDDSAVLVNTATYDVFDAKPLSSFDLDDFTQPESLSILGLLSDIASDSFAKMDNGVAVISSGKARSAFRVPQAVQENAKHALLTVSRTRTLPSPVALNLARRLVNGGSLTLDQIHHMARFFVALASQDENASEFGQLEWDLFGGDAGRRWSLGIASQHVLVAAAPETAAPAKDAPAPTETTPAPENGPEPEKSGESKPADAAPNDYEDVEGGIDGGQPHVFFPISGLEDVCAICASAEDDARHIDLSQLPADHPEHDMIEEFQEDSMTEPVTASVALQDDVALPLPEGNGISYFAERDASNSEQLVELFYSDDQGRWFEFSADSRDWLKMKAPGQESSLFPLDEDTAFAMMGRLLANPEYVFDLRDAFPEEFVLAERAALQVAEDVDHLFADYTPVERSANASKQIRDRNGKFARTGTSVSTTGDRSGQVVGFDAKQRKVEVKMDDNGRSEFYSQNDITVQQPENVDAQPDAQPTETPSVPKARLSAEAPMAEGEAVAQLIDKYSENIHLERERRNSSKQLADTPIPAEGDAVPAADPAPTDSTTPDPASSDVKPLYLAIVDKLDPTAVLELISLTPKSADSSDVVAWKREKKSWVEDDNLLLQLKSVTPPDIVTLDDTTYQDVVTQVDAFEDQPQTPQSDTPDAAPPAPTTTPASGPSTGQAVAAGLVEISGDFGETIELAEGGLDRNRGNAEVLRRYWLYGPGAAKIVWGTPGDWTRCVANLAKYMGTRAKGYCQLRHKDADGYYTGDHRNLAVEGEFDWFDNNFPTDEEVITAAATRVIDTKESAPQEVNDVQAGAPFTIKVVVPIGVETGDGRSFQKGSLSTRDFPLPLMWQIKTGSAHDGSVIVGRIDGAEINDDGIGNAFGVFDTGPFGQEAERLVREKFLRGISADLDKFEASQVQDDEEALGEEAPKIAAQKLEISGARLTGITLVPKPAFQECTIELDDQSEDPMKVEDGVYVEAPDERDAEPLMAAAMVASAIPVHPPSNWFDDPELREPTPLTVDANGRVFGHIAAWHVDHIGMNLATKPPKSRTNYAYFHTGTLTCEDEKKIPVGQLTLAGGHAPLNVDAAAAVRHYDDTASAIADVHAGEDSHGIWVSGALRPSVSPEQIRVLQASAPSGDWRPINGRLELVAVCQVNVPGFPITRAFVASGHVFALVAAGASVLARRRVDPFEERLARLETTSNAQLAKQRALAVSKIDDVRNEHQAVLLAAAKEATKRINDILPNEADAFADVSDARRKFLAKRGAALPDGSYPISDVAHLKKAIMAYGRSSPEDREKVKRHIKKRARALGRTDLLPDKWTSASVEERYQDIRAQFKDTQHSEVLASREEARQKFAGIVGKESDAERRIRKMIETNPDFDSAAHPRDSSGKFRDVVARLRDQLKSTPDAREAVRALDSAQQAEAEKNFAKAKLAGERAIHILDTAAAGTRVRGDAKTMREAASQLGKAVAYLPVGIGAGSVVFSFEQLDNEIKGLIQNLLNRAEKNPDPSKDQLSAIKTIKDFMRGADQWTQPELNAALSRLVRLLL